MDCEKKELKRKLRAAVHRIYALGHKPGLPFFGTPPIGKGEREAYAYYMGLNMESLLLCDAVYMADRQWAVSRECSIEHHAASVTGMVIYYDMEDIPANENNHDKKQFER